LQRQQQQYTLIKQHNWPIQWFSKPGLHARTPLKFFCPLYHWLRSTHAKCQAQCQVRPLSSPVSSPCYQPALDRLLTAALNTLPCHQHSQHTRTFQYARPLHLFILSRTQ
jgi:hypothetical protein